MNHALTNERGEYTGADGKLWHLSPDASDEYDHEGAWLDCDVCNPMVPVVPAAFAPAQRDKLIELRAAYDETKRKAKAAEEEFDTAKGRLQAALAEASGNALRASLQVPGFKNVTLIYTEPWRVDSKRLKAENPAVYVQYAKQGQQWTLAESRSKS